jgi:hypothetical protein
VALVIVLGVGAALFLMEWDEYEESVGFSDAAMANPYLAAHRFLERFEIDVQRAGSMNIPDALPPVEHVLLISGTRYVQPERHVRALIEWVQDGGHLVVTAESFSDTDHETPGDALLERLGVHLFRVDGIGAVASNAEPVPGALPQAWMRPRAPRASCGPDAGITDLWLDGEHAAARALMPWQRRLAYAEGGDAAWVASASNGAGMQILQLGLGHGMLTVLTSAELWRNDLIHCHDHAHLLRHVVGDAMAVSWVMRVGMPSLPALLWQRFPAVLLMLGAALVLWLWHLVVRPGPVIPAAERSRRGVLDHVDGVARFYWQQRSSALLLEPMQREVIALLAQRARRTGMDRGLLLDAVAAECGVPLAQARRALATTPAPDSAQLTRTVQILQQLRNSL